MDESEQTLARRPDDKHRLADLCQIKSAVMSTTRVLFSSASTLPHPDAKQFNTWVSLVLTQQKRAGNVSIYLVDTAEGLRLNQQYRGKDYATNVLAFPADTPMKRAPRLLGDLVLCVPVVLEEAEVQHKQPQHHFAHLTTHGILHLLGFDHVNTADANIMEALEIALLAKLGIPNPYESETHCLTLDGVTTSHG